MFSGIVEAVSRIERVDESRGQRVVSIRQPRGWKLARGQSISVEGVCSTVQKANGRLFTVVYMPETLRRTTLNALARHDFVNLERCLRLSSLIGGHLVLGHVDATARIAGVQSEGETKIFEFEIPPRLSRYVVRKGSVAVDGVSLTVVDSKPGRFRASLLAYTLAHTTLGRKGPGDRVNVEMDILAKYLEQMVRR